MWGINSIQHFLNIEPFLRLQPVYFYPTFYHENLQKKWKSWNNCIVNTHVLISQIQQLRLWCIYFIIYPSIYLSIHLSLNPLIYLSICLSIDPSIHPSIHSSIHLFILLSIHQPILYLEEFQSKLQHISTLQILQYAYY